jgi:probable F420-dependent oxidoreductase
MRFGLFAINYGTCGDPEAAVTVARAAEEAGFESVWAAEHIVLPDPQVAGSPMAPGTPLLAPVVALTLVAAHTTTLRLGTGVVLVPLRHPLLLAKELASVDVASGGRLIVGVGAGYLEAEFDALSVPLHEAGPRMDDHLRALRAAWTADQPVHAGPFASFGGVDAHPRPLQRPAPPLVVGGASRAAFRRAVTMGDGWYGFGADLDLTAQCLHALAEAAERHERPAGLGDVEITITPSGPLGPDVVRSYEELGVHRLVLLPDPGAHRSERHRPVPLPDILRNVERVGDLLIR